MLRRLSHLMLAAALACGAAFAANTAPQIPAMPPDVAAAIAKVQAHQTLTPGERALIQNYGKQMTAKYGGGAGNGGGGGPGDTGSSAGATTFTALNPFTTGTGVATNPCTRKGSAAGFGVTPSRDAFLAMARDAASIYRGHLLPQARSSLDSVLSAGTVSGSDVGALLAVHGNGSAAIVSAAYAVQKSPDDALAANNLGALLRGMHDYARAAIALQYARSKAPDSPVIANNLGWLAFGQGDTKTASGFFQAAGKNTGSLAPTLLGQGLIALCSGNRAQALPLLRASIANGYSEVAADAIFSADADLQAAGKASQDTTPPSVYGGPSTGPGGAGSAPDWPEPVFPQNVHEMAGSQAAVAAYSEYWSKRVQRDAIVQGSLATNMAGAARTTTGTLRQMTFNRGYGKEKFEIADIMGIFARRMAPEVQQFAVDMDNAIQRGGCYGCGEHKSPPECQMQSTNTALHSTLYAEERSTWGDIKNQGNDMYAFVAGPLSRIHNAALLQFTEASLDGQMGTEATSIAGDIRLWQMQVYFVFDTPNNCRAASIRNPLRYPPLKPFPSDPTQCHSGSLELPFGFANLHAGCDAMQLTIGEGLVGAATWKFAPDYTKGPDGVLRPNGPDWRNDQISIFVGVGGQSNLLPGINPNGAIGGFVTVQNGQLIDAGGQAQVGLSPGTGPASLQLGATGKVGIMSGPDVSTSSAVRIGAPCGFSC